MSDKEDRFEEETENRGRRGFRLSAIPGAVMGGLDRIAQFFDAGFRRLSGGFRIATEFTTRADSWIGRLTRVLVAPVRSLWRIAERLGTSLQKLPVLKPIFKVLRFSLYPFLAIAGFATAYARSRQHGLKWRALPVLIVLGGVFAILFATYLVRNSILPTRYRAAIFDAIEVQDLERADLFRQKLRQLGQPFGDTDLRAANRLIEQGRPEEALELVQSLAPIDAPGEPAAHFWIIVHLLDSEFLMDTAEVIRQAASHVRQLQSLGFGDRPEVVMASAVIALRQNRVDEALEILEPVAKTFFPAANLRLALLLEQNRNAAAIDAAGVFLRVGASDPQLLENATLEQLDLWEKAAEMQSDFKTVETVLQKWRSRFPGDKSVIARLAKNELRELDRFHPASSTSEAEGIVNLIERVAGMLQYENREIIGLALARMRFQSTRIPVFDEALDLLDNNSDEPLVIEHLGTEAAIAENWTKSREMLTRATQLDPQDPVAWNNLAFVIWKSSDEIQLALQAANRSLELAPYVSDSLETRGLILHQLGEWQKAADDLEMAYIGLPESKDLLLALADCHEKLGNPEKAGIYRRNAGQ